MTTYSYTPLSSSRHEIRLLHLLPGKLDDPIKCALESCPLDTIPTYEALSYVWGDKENPLRISIQESELPINRNLHNALKYLRSPTKTRILWVDAICINQSDVGERESQVGFMDVIYSRAERVLCWLGPSEQDSGIIDPSGESITMDEALGLVGCNRDGIVRPCFLNDCSHFDCLEGRLRTLQTRPGSLVISDLDAILGALYLIDFVAHGWEEPHPFGLFDDNPDDPRSITYRLHGRLDSAVKFLRKIFTSPWWNRMWIFQEIVLAKDAVLVYHHLTIPWATMNRAGNKLSFHWQNCCSRYIERLRDDDKSFLGLWRETGGEIRLVKSTPGFTYSFHNLQTMMGLLSLCSSRGATDPRDKVHAVLGLVKDCPGLKPDYRSSADQVYIQATIHMIRGSNTLHGLCCRPYMSNSNRYLPSWVHDWRESLKEYPHKDFRSLERNLYNAGSRITSQPRLCCDSILVLEGAEIDTIAAMGMICDLSSETQIINTLRDWEATARKQAQRWDEPYPNGQSRPDAFCSTLGADLVMSKRRPSRILGGTPPDYCRSGVNDELDNDLCRDWGRLFRQVEADQEIAGLRTEKQDWIDHFLDVVGQAIFDLRFFVTQRGLMGVGPNFLQLHDKVWVLKGGDTPFALRSPSTGMLGKGSCSHPQKMCFEAIGRCYVHGIMDGQVMGPDQNWIEFSRGRWNVTWNEEVKYEVQEVHIV